ncbi:hypothetical protein Tco_0586838 [Tanacetum coccineum]
MCERVEQRESTKEGIRDRLKAFYEISGKEEITKVMGWNRTPERRKIRRKIDKQRCRKGKGTEVQKNEEVNKKKERVQRGVKEERYGEGNEVEKNQGSLNCKQEKKERQEGSRKKTGIIKEDRKSSRHSRKRSNREKDRIKETELEEKKGGKTRIGKEKEEKQKRRMKVRAEDEKKRGEKE